MATQYNISISMSPTTIDLLKNGGYALYGFKAVKTAQQGGAPLVWFQSTTFLTTTTVNWQEQYQSFISTSKIISNGQIDASSNENIGLGQTMQVTENGLLSVVTTGTEKAISIDNQGSTQWTCGISQMAGNVATPMCAFPLYGKMLDVFVPISKVLLMFASNTVNTGTVVYKAYSSGVLLDLTGAQSRTVSFDINKGWDWGNSPWGTTVAASADMVPLLISG